MASQQPVGHPVPFGGEPDSLLAQFRGPLSTGQFLLASVQAAVAATAQ